MAEGNEHSGKSFGGRKSYGHGGSGRPGNRGGKGFKPRGKGGFGGRKPYGKGGSGFHKDRDFRRDGDGERRGGYRKDFHKDFRKDGDFRKDRDFRRDGDGERREYRKDRDFHKEGGFRKDRDFRKGGDGERRGGRRDRGIRPQLPRRRNSRALPQRSRGQRMRNA